MIKLESLLAKAKPERKTKTPSDWMASYLDEHGVRNQLASLLPGMTSDVKKMSGSWNTIPLLIGLLYRMNEDGADVLTQLGLSQDEIVQFRRICMKIREQCSTVGVAANTPSKILYDQVKQLGF